MVTGKDMIVTSMMLLEQCWHYLL